MSSSFPTDETKNFAEEVISASRRSFPTELGQPDWPTEVDYSLVISWCVVVTASLFDKEQKEKIAVLSFLVKIDAPETDATLPLVRKVLQGEVRVFKSESGVQRVAKLRYVQSDPSFVVPAHISANAVKSLLAKPAGEQLRWIRQIPLRFF